MRRNVTTYDPNLPSGKKFVAVHVQNEGPLYFLVEVKSKVCELFAQISKFLNVLEPELFGLAIQSSGTHIFLDPLEKLCKYAPKQWRTQNNGMDNDGQPLFHVYFRVQFYVESYLFISDKVAKLFYYHQMRENVLCYEQAMCEERAFLLASYALQADYGNFNAKLHKDKYFEPRQYFPAWVIDELGVDYITRHLPALHCDHKGMSKSEAQSMYIKEASDPSSQHNFHQYQLVCKKGNSASDVWLAITISGIAIYTTENSATYQRRLKSRISFFPWSDIGKLSFEKKKFEIRSTGPQGRKFVYYAVSEEVTRHLLWFSRASHQFHLMVQTKMKEMIKREAEINRRKYRETCISTSSSRTSSGNSSGSGSINPSNTSKSASPFEFSSTSSSTSVGPKKGTSDLDISNSSVCGEDVHSNHPDQRISVISNASSNTTSGIVSDKLHGLEDSDRDDIDSDLLMNLNHHHHHQMVSRAITLSGCSPQPVVSMESLAMSEPTEHHHHRSGESGKMNLANHKKHSISIGNIMITANTSNSSQLTHGSDRPSTVPSNDVPESSTTHTTVTTKDSHYAPVNEVMVNGDNSSKVLCLNINDSSRQDLTCCSLSPYSGKTDEDDCTSEDDFSAYDDTDSIFDTNNRYTSSKSNVTVLSTILKPEAERLLKQGIVADDAELLIDDGIDSFELAELKEFEQAEKEKIILNSLINNIPPPTMSTSTSDSDSSDLEEDDDLNNNRRKNVTRRNKHCYSPLSQEKLMHHKQQKSMRHSSSPKSGNFGGNRLRNQRSSSNSSTGSYNSTSSKDRTDMSVQSANALFFSKLNGKSHIYENLPAVCKEECGSSRASETVAALVTPLGDGLPPALPLHQAPSLNTFATPSKCTPYQHRTGMRIGVSSLTRPYNGHKASLLNGGCIHQATTRLFATPNNTNVLNGSTLSAGSEPNLYITNTNCWPSSAVNSTRHTSSNKSDSIFDCRAAPLEDKHHCSSTPEEVSKTTQPITTTSFRQFIKNQLGSQSSLDKTINSIKICESVIPKLMNMSEVKLRTSLSQDNNNNIEKLIVSEPMTCPPPAEFADNTESSSPVTSSNTSQSDSNASQKGKESRLNQLRQRSSDLNLPLITALFNDRSLALSHRFKSSDSALDVEAPKNGTKSQSLQQIPRQVSRSSASSNGVERTSTFRVDEAIAKSAMRQQDANNNHKHQVDYHTSASAIRPTSWHVSPEHYYQVSDAFTNKYYQPIITNGSRVKLFNADRIWAEHQLTT